MNFQGIGLDYLLEKTELVKTKEKVKMVYSPEIIRKGVPLCNPLRSYKED